MTVENQIFELELLFIFILVDEGSLELSFLAEIELLHLYLLRKIHSVLRHPLVDGLLRTPVDGELLVLLFVIKVVNLILRESFLFYGRKVPVQRLHVDSHLFLIMDDDGYIFLGVCDADVCHAVLKIRLAVVMVVEVHLLFEHLVDKCPHSQFLSSLAFAAEQRYLFKFVIRDRYEIHQLFFCLGYLPYGDLRLVFQFLS